MSLAITIELGDADLQHFVDAMKKAQAEAKNLSPKQIADAASQLLVEGHNVKVPHFIAERLHKLSEFILKRKHLHVATVHHKSEYGPFVRQVFELVGRQGHPGDGSHGLATTAFALTAHTGNAAIRCSSASHAATDRKSVV